MQIVKNFSFSALRLLALSTGKACRFDEAMKVLD